MRKNIMLVMMVAVMFNSCVKTDDYEIPDFTEPELNIDGDLTTIAAVKGNFYPATGEIYTFRDSNTFFEGYVISSDEGGNFYKEVIVQDKPEDP
ncbi:MAG TPA: DUF5689 domain-containing protein, partial [Christiangramia sp.]|nr:DUF5689 domain-containing protein [Christiangramia sp.]